MATNDRSTTIDGSQIEDKSLGPTEFDASNEPRNRQVLQYDSNTAKFVWRWSIFGRLFR